jgi:hypothetical protein
LSPSVGPDPTFLSGPGLAPPSCMISATCVKAINLRH